MNDELDGIRALAVLSVMAFHADLFGGGWIGVPIFFVLSGFLITRNLLRDKELRLGTYLRTFYGRRVLRIAPLYYAYLLVVVVASRGAGGPPGLGHALAQTYDFYRASKAFQYTDLLGHFWSLSVEEQFYLVWPMLVYALPRRSSSTVFAAIVLAGPVVRLATAIVWPSLPWGAAAPRAVYSLPWCHVDAFATGAWLATVRRHSTRGRVVLAAIAATSATGFLTQWSAGVVDVDTLGLRIALPHAWHFVWGYTMLDVTSALAIDAALAGGPLARALRMRGLRHVGKISYGVYVLHLPVQSLVAPWIRLRSDLGSPPVVIHVEVFAAVALITLVVASASFRWFERPLLRLKDRWFAHAAADHRAIAVERIAVLARARVEGPEA